MAGSVTVQAAGTCSPDSAIRLQMSVNQRYRAGGLFATNSGVLSYWRRLRADAGGTTGPWLLAPPSSPGMPETLYGSGVIEDANINNHGSAVKSVAFGDFQRGYLIHDAGLRIERSDDYAFANDLASFRAVWRLDGQIRDNNAIAVYQATAN
jgi:HK97 family phage major capsid protein